MRSVANPIANLFQKQLAQRAAVPFAVIVVTHGVLSAMALPILVRLPLAGLAAAFWTNMAIAALLAVVGYVLMWYALRSTDMSILGPVNAYKAVIGLLLAAFLIGEVPTVAGVIGVVLIVAGSYFVVDRVPGEPRRRAWRQFVREHGVQLRVAALLCSATESVFLKRALLLSTPLTAFLIWAVFCFVAAVLAVALRRRGRAAVMRLRGEWRTLLWLTASTAVMQLTTLVAFRALQVGYSLALFQLSTLVSVYLGHRYFRERNVGRRLIGSLIMVVGAILIVTLGRRA